MEQQQQLTLMPDGTMKSLHEHAEWNDQRWIENLKALREETEKHQTVVHERMLEMMDRYDGYVREMRSDAGL